MLAGLKAKINIKNFMVAYLGALTAFSSFYLGHPFWFVKSLIIVALYTLFDLGWTRLKGGGWYLPTSSWISGFIISMVALPNPPYVLVIALPLIAVVTKHLLHFGKSRHLLNPAASALVAVGIFTPVTMWWGMSWGNIPLITVAIIGLFILWRQGRFETAFAFLSTYLILSAFSYLFFGGSFYNIPYIWATLLSFGGNIFFITVMLIEPITSSFPGRRRRIIYGMTVALVAVIVDALVALSGNQKLDPLLIGLLVGNFLIGMIFLPAAPKQTVVPARQSVEAV